MSNIAPIASEYEVDYDKNITILYESICNSDWDTAVSTVVSQPIEAKTWVVRHYEDEEGVDADGEREVMWRFLPIHSACARQPPSSVISSLLKAYPDGARCVDDQGMYPLHYACGNQASRDVIRLLLVSFPQAAKIADPQGMLPIHYVACWGPSVVGVIDMVMVANKDVADAKDVDGNTPLDLALEGEYPERDDVVSVLRRWFSGSARVSAASPARREIEAALEAAKAPAPEPVVVEEEELAPEPVPEPVVQRSAPKAFDRGVAAAAPSRKKKDISPAASEESTDTKSTDKTITRLRAEIAKLKADKAFNAAELDERVQEEEDKFQAIIKELKKELAEVKGDAADKARTIDARDARIKNLEEKVEDKEAEVKKASEEMDKLQESLFEVTEKHDHYKAKAETMGDRLGSLSASLTSMIEDQDKIMSAAAKQQEFEKQASQLRQEKLQELIDQEVRLNMDSLETSEGEGSTLKAFEKQKREMDAIAAVIATMRV